MIKANELRIGNWVMDEKNTPYQWFKCDYLEMSNYMNLVNPIPLTEEWLLKFGFENSLVKEIFIHNKISFPPTSIIYDNGKYIFRKRIELEIKYVHQLQNLYFALTNEELTLNDSNETTD